MDLTEQIEIRKSQHLKISEHSNIELLDNRALANIRTFEHYHIGEHSNLKHFKVQKLANITEHSNVNIRRSVAPVQRARLP